MATTSESWRPFLLLVAALMLSAGMAPHVSATGRHLLQAPAPAPAPRSLLFQGCHTNGDCSVGLECDIARGQTIGICYFADSGPGGPCRIGNLQIACQAGLYCVINETYPMGRSGYCEFQGVCGTGAARDFPRRCFFNNEPQGRYVCCDNNGCAGFTSDNLTPQCAKNASFVPPNFGVTTGAGAAPAGALVDATVACPSRNGFATNPCFNKGGGKHVCCPDSCGAFDANGGPTCTNNNYVIFN